MPVFLAVVLVGCGNSVSQASFISQDSSSASLLQWTQTGHSVSGSLALAGLATGSLQTKNFAFSGTISGSSVTLTFPEGLGATKSTVGTISGSHLRLSIPASDGTLVGVDFLPGTVADYNRAVGTLGQQSGRPDQAEADREASVRWGIRSIQVGIESYAVDHNNAYPPDVTQETLVDSTGQRYVDKWPDNPYTGASMAPSAGAGDYAYTTDGASFQLVGYGRDGVELITVP